MKIAIATEGSAVTAHFGHCETFVIFTATRNKIIKKEIIPNPGHRPGFLPNFLNDLGVDVIISGGMGQAAVEIFNSHNIEVVIGTSGDADDVIAEYLAGNLQYTGDVCHAHEHK